MYVCTYILMANLFHILNQFVMHLHKSSYTLYLIAYCPRKFNSNYNVAAFPRWVKNMH
jgi:hypothetical protein